MGGKVHWVKEHEIPSEQFEPKSFYLKNPKPEFKFPTYNREKPKEGKKNQTQEAEGKAKPPVSPPKKEENKKQQGQKSKKVEQSTVQKDANTTADSVLLSQILDELRAGKIRDNRKPKSRDKKKNKSKS